MFFTLRYECSFIFYVRCTDPKFCYCIFRLSLAHYTKEQRSPVHFQIDRNQLEAFIRVSVLALLVFVPSPSLSRSSRPAATDPHTLVLVGINLKWGRVARPTQRSPAHHENRTSILEYLDFFIVQRISRDPTNVPHRIIQGL
jgi:hypothetical protein